MTAVDVIVLDIDGGPMLDACLASIAAQTVPPQRTIVLDNGSRTPLERSDVEVLRSDRNLGFAGGVNHAAARTTAPYIALVNNDVVLEPDWLAHVRDALDRDPQLAAVQTIIRRPDGAIDGAGIDIRDGTFRQIGHGKPVGDPLEVAWGVSATAALYRVAATTRHLFDDRFFAYYEDVELCARLKRDGWRIAVLPLVKATHRGSQSAGILGAQSRYLRTRNRYFVARMHRHAGSIPALLWEDAKLALRWQSSLRGIWDGLTSARVRAA